MIEQLIRDDLKEFKPYSSARDEFKGLASIFLDANENPFDNGVNRYPDPLQQSLKNRIAEIKGIQPNQLLLGNGSDECIDLLFRLFCVSGKDEVATIVPSYGMYKITAKLYGVSLNEILLNYDFSLNVEKTLEEAKNAKLLFLCSPNNPTGNCFPEEDLLEIVSKFKGIVVVDEAYIDFATQKSLSAKIDEFPNLVIIQTFSKAFGMAGIRLGLLIANSSTISWLNKIKAPYNINILTQNFALDKLKNIGTIQKSIITIILEREKLIQLLKEIPLVETVFPSDANFILIKVKNADEVYSALLKENIVVRNRSKEVLCDSCLRITVGTENENLKLIQTLKNLNK